jgi:uncharacterized RDD family membrane protein YckC
VIDPLRPAGVPYPAVPPVVRNDLPPDGPGAPARVGLRATARIIDFVIVLMPATLLGELFGVGRNDEGLLEGPTWPRFILPVTFVLYETLMVAWRGQTIGKLLCRIQVVQWSTGQLPTAKEAALRAVVPGVFFFLYLLGGPFGLLLFVPSMIYLSSVADPVRRGVHDRAGETIVLSAAPAELPG